MHLQKHTEISWTFPTCKPTSQEKRDLFGIMVEIGNRVLFTNFCYTFRGKIFLQQVGGPIGARITMAASRLRMHVWGEKYGQILFRSSIHMYITPTNYVDNVRQATDEIERGKRFDAEKNMII